MQRRTGRIRKPPFFPLNYEDSAIFDFRLPIANASRIELFVCPQITRPPGLRRGRQLNSRRPNRNLTVSKVASWQPCLSISRFDLGPGGNVPTP